MSDDPISPEEELKRRKLRLARLMDAARMAPEVKRDVTIGTEKSDQAERLFDQQELIVTRADPHIMAPLSRIKELGTASNTGWTAAFTFCAGALVSTAPLGIQAISDLYAGRLPGEEARNQLMLFLPAIPLAIVSGIFVVRKLGHFNRLLETLQTGKRFLWDESSNKTTPLAAQPARAKTRLWDRVFNWFTNDRTAASNSGEGQ